MKAPSKKIVIPIFLFLCLFHIITVKQVPQIDPLEGWYIDPAYSYYKFGNFSLTMFPEFVEYDQNGPFGWGKWRTLLHSWAFHILGFGIHQARLPMVLGGLLSAYFLFLTARLLYGTQAGIYSAGLYLLAPIFYHSHESQSHSWLTASLILAAYFFIHLLIRKRNVFAFLSGLTIGLSLNIHYSGILGVIPLTVLIIYFLYKRKINGSNTLAYFFGGFIALTVWYFAEIAPLGIKGFINESSVGNGIIQNFTGLDRWIEYFFFKNFGLVIELPLLLLALISFRWFWNKSTTRFFYLFFVGIFTMYTICSSQIGEIMPVWAALFIIIGGLISIFQKNLSGLCPVLRKAFFSILMLVLLYYTAVFCKRAYTAFWIRPADHHTELIEKMVKSIPEGKKIIGSPLYWFGFVGRNPYFAQGFYWSRIDSQTNELGYGKPHPIQVRTKKMIAFLKRLNIEYLIADDYFLEDFLRWVPEHRWNEFFNVESQFQSPFYGGYGGSKPPYSIKILRMIPNDANKNKRGV